MKDIALSGDFVKRVKEIRNKDRNLYKKIKKQLELFQNNPHHPSLRTHKLTGSLKNVWSISIDKNYRILYQDGNLYYFFALGTHDQVYKS